MTPSLFLQIIKGVKSYFSAKIQEERAESPSRLQVGVFCMLLAVVALLSLQDYNSFQIGTYMDDASYAVLAQSIVFSDSYGLMNVPGKPDPARYPFGFPLLLSPLAWMFPQMPDVMKGVSLLATLLNATLLFWGWPFLSRNRSYWWGLAIAALYSVSPMAIGHTRMVMSEPIFTMFVLLALILTEKHLAVRREKPLFALASGVAAFFALFTRTVGIALVLAVWLRILALPFSRVLRVRRLAWFLAGGILLVSVMVIVTPITFGNLMPTQYADQFSNPWEWGQTHTEETVIPRLLGAFRDYTGPYLRRTVMPIGGGNEGLAFGKRFGIPDLPRLVGIAIGVLVLLGSLPVFQGEGLSPSTFILEILYFGIILPWPWREARFLYPIQPFLFYHLLCGVGLVTRQLGRGKWISPIAVRFLTNLNMVVCFALILFLSLYKGVAGGESNLQHTRDLRVGSMWLRENSPREAIVMTQQPQAIYLYSQRRTVGYTDISTTVELKDEIEAQSIDYILVAPRLEWREDEYLEYDTYTSAILLPIVNELVTQGFLELVYQSSKDMVLVYRVAAV